MKFTKKQIERYSRQIILKRIGIIGQKKLLASSVLIVGLGGLGSPIAIYLAAMGIGKIGLIDKDKVELSNLSRQIIFSTKDLKKLKTSSSLANFAKNFSVIVDGTDNFRTRFLLNDYCLKNKKILISGAISKFDGQVYTFNFLKKKSPCLRCFIPNMPSNPDIDNCEYEGVMGALGGIVGSIQANEVIKEIVGIGESLCGHILIIDGLKLSFRKIILNKRSDCYCNEKKI